MLAFKIKTYRRILRVNQNISSSTTAQSLETTYSRQFLDWLQEEQISLAFTTYQTSRLMFIGVNSEGEFSGFERLFNRAMGLYATPERLYLSTKYQLWQLDNVLLPAQLYEGHDKLYIPRIAYTTGDLDIHDIAVDNAGRIIFVSTLLNCLATVSERNSCTPLWKPPFISKVINEDRCHLNGLAMVEGKPRFVTAVSQSDVIDGWRDRRQASGCVIDIESNEIILAGLSMPHSPRWYRDKLWLLNSGTGFFGSVDIKTGKFEPITFCPGYLRGLAFWKDYAIVGLSKPRSEEKTFSGLALNEELIAKDAEPRCGFMVINLNTGAIVHWLRFEGLIAELYDIQILPNVRRPMALGFQTDEISRLITLDPMQSV
ncbi:TIGR03032 family protein [Microcoleus sp. FACHB-68]|nr:TIGR03032 family protein [Microcoleus sp. FACHB-68]